MKKKGLRLHHDVKYFPKDDTFDPDRITDAYNEKSFIPFGNELS